jgi:hypothetical protein
MYLNQAYTKVHTDKNLSDAHPIYSGLKQDVLSELFLSSALEYAIRKVKKLELNWLL